MMVFLANKSKFRADIFKEHASIPAI